MTSVIVTRSGVLKRTSASLCTPDVMDMTHVEMDLTSWTVLSSRVRVDRSNVLMDSSVRGSVVMEMMTVEMDQMNGTVDH